MKYFITILFLLFSFGAFAQSEVVLPPDSLTTTESPVIVLPSILDTIACNIVSSDSLKKGVDSFIKKNSSRVVTLYRLRIFFDNSQDARNVSAEIADEFSTLYPDVPVFRGYVNPYFKVTVGNYRSKSEAMKFLQQIKGKYPSVFLVKESVTSAQSR